MERYRYIVPQKKEVRKVINAVLLQGFLSKERLEQAFGEIQEMCQKKYDIVLVVASNGGDTLAAVSFVERIKLDSDVQTIEVKIYEASSTAAFIVLALRGCSTKIEMNKNAVFGIHRGEIRLSPSQISLEDVIDKGLADSFRTYDAALVDVLQTTELYKDEKLMAELYATDWLRIPAEECLRRGIVQRLF